MQREIKAETGQAREGPVARQNPLLDVARWLVQTQEGILLIFVVALSLFLSLTSPVFLTQRNIGVLLSQISMTAIAACGMTALIIAGEVDLSVGSVQAFIGVLAMQTLNQTKSLPLGLATALGVGALIGLVNAGLTLGLRINSFVVTLAMLSILRGSAYISTNAAVQNGHELPAFRDLGNGFVSVIPWPVLIMAFVFILFYLVLNRTTLGRHIYVTGGNPRAAALAGVRIKLVKTLCFVLTSILAAVSAMHPDLAHELGPKQRRFRFRDAGGGGRAAGWHQPTGWARLSDRHAARRAPARDPQQRHHLARHQLELADRGQRPADPAGGVHRCPAPSRDG